MIPLIRSRPDKMMLRWAVGSLRVYAPNRLHVARTLAANGRLVGVRAELVAVEAGCWHEHAGLVLPVWDWSTMQDSRKSGIGA